MNTQTLRQKILDLAIRGKLVPQDPNDESASVLLERIRQQKQQMVKGGKLKPKDIKNDTVIFVGEDNLHYEKFADGSVKCIEDEIPFEVPKGWAWCRLRNICLMNAGKAKPSTQIKSDPFDGCYKCYGGNGVRGYVDEYNYDGTYNIVGRQGALCGNINVASGKFYATEHAVVTTFFDGICFCWSTYMLEALRLNNYATGAAQPGLSVANVLNILVPVPPIQEQKQIEAKIAETIVKIELIDFQQENLYNSITQIKSKILDLAICGKLVPQDPNDEPASVLLGRIRAEKEELIKQGKIKRDKKESVIFRGEDNSYYENINGVTKSIDAEKLFDLPSGWTYCRLENLGATQNNSFVDGPFGSNLKTEHYTDNREVRIIQLNNIGEFAWKNTGIRYTTFEHAETLSRCTTYPGDIVIAKMMPAGRAIIIPPVENIFVISSDCVRLRATEHVDSKFLVFLINSSSINRSIVDTVHGIGRSRTSLTKLKKVLIPLPPLNEQKRIVSIIEETFSNLDSIANILL